MPPKILIIDGLNMFLRNFVVQSYSDLNGNPVGGLVGTLRSVKSMIRETGAGRVFFVWDGKGGAQRRRGVIADYKMGRRPRLNRPVDEGLEESDRNRVWQQAKLKALLDLLGATQIEVDNIEADDTIGYLVGALDPKPKVVVSSDKDMWQLVSDTTTVYWPTKKIYITTGTFKDVCPFHPANYILARALSGKGDSSDNIHGIKGLGEKTLLKIFPVLAKEPITENQFFADLDQTLHMAEAGLVEPPLKDVEKRWMKAVLTDRDLVSRNAQVMQLTEPNISAQAAGIIRGAIALKPTFNVSGFKVALLNNGIQLTDQDFFTTFQEYRIRVENAR
jgi:5'-3' exonuclease